MGFMYTEDAGLAKLGLGTQKSLYVAYFALGAQE